MNKHVKFEVISGYVLAFLTLAFALMLFIYEFALGNAYADSLQGFDGLWAFGFVLVYIIMYVPTAIVLIIVFGLTLSFTGNLLHRAKAQKLLLAGELSQDKKYKAPSLIGLIVVKIIGVVAMAFGAYLGVFSQYATVFSYVFYPTCALLTLASAVISCINHKKVKF